MSDDDDVVVLLLFSRRSREHDISVLRRRLQNRFLLVTLHPTKISPTANSFLI